MFVSVCSWMYAPIRQTVVKQSKKLSTQDWDLDSIPGFATNEFCDYLKIADTKMFLLD